jgi:uncharacterized integral membrane protein
MACIPIIIGLLGPYYQDIRTVVLYFCMGERIRYQPLTKEDRITVVLYRTGILLSAVTICVSAVLAVIGMNRPEVLDYPVMSSGLAMDVLLLILYLSVGLSVFFIHLYVGKFHRVLKKIYYFAVACLAVLFFMGRGNPAVSLFSGQGYGALLLIPVSLCLGFVTAKEAFCFQLLEGYILAFLMPAYLFFYALGALSHQAAAYGLALIAALYLLFTFRKVFMPLDFDIGDKSAYQP